MVKPIKILLIITISILLVTPLVLMEPLRGIFPDLDTQLTLVANDNIKQKILWGVMYYSTLAVSFLGIILCLYYLLKDRFKITVIGVIIIETMLITELFVSIYSPKLRFMPGWLFTNNLDKIHEIVADWPRHL